MTDRSPSPSSLPKIMASNRGLLDQHVFQEAVHMTRMPMALADPNLPDCPLVYVNPAFTDLTGYAPEEALGRNCRFLQGPDTDPDDVARLRDALALNVTCEIEIYNYRKDGSGFWNALHISPVFDDGGRLIYYFASQIDVSAQKEASRRQAQRMESMGALASGVAHEFNNLMTVVVGNVERAASGPLDARQKHHLGRADRAARRAGELAGELLSLARRQSTDERVVDLNDVVRAFECTLAEATAPGIAIRLDLAPEATFARLDRGQLELVLLNLVRNASSAMGESGEIVIATRMLPPAAAEAALDRKSAVELSVTDTGVGMSPEIAGRATELFFTTKTAGKGTGLGLFLALEFVDHSGGKLRINTEPGKGTTVRMAFPQSAAT